MPPTSWIAATARLGLAIALLTGDALKGLVHFVFFALYVQTDLIRYTQLQMPTPRGRCQMGCEIAARRAFLHKMLLLS